VSPLFGDDCQVTILQWRNLLDLAYDPLPIRIPRHALPSSFMGCQIWISDGDKNLPRVNAGMIIAKPVRDRAVFFQERNALLTQ
jgi:hypothetical protein